MENVAVSTILGTPVSKELGLWYGNLIEDVKGFWQQGPYIHYTRHGFENSKDLIENKIQPLVQQLSDPLTPDEAFILAAAAWLYETGMQSTIPSHHLNFTFDPDKDFTIHQLEQLRKNKNVLSYELIINSANGIGTNRPWHSAQIVKSDYVRTIAKVCVDCSVEIDAIKPVEIVNGRKVRHKLLSVLLSLAEQLSMSRNRIDVEILKKVSIPLPDQLRWWLYQYIEILPPEHGKIAFHYIIPSDYEKNILNYIRSFYEPLFEYKNNKHLQYLFDHGISLRLDDGIYVDYDTKNELEAMSDELKNYLLSNHQPNSGNDVRKPEERCLLVLDYENFILQLGLQGVFITDDQIEKVLIELLKYARNLYGQIRIDALAIGHWMRQDLQEVVKKVRNNFYQPVIIELYDESGVGKLHREIEIRLQSASSPNRIIFIAPNDDYSFLVQNVSERLPSTAAWLANLPETEKYVAVITQIIRFSDILKIFTEPVLDKDIIAGDAAAIIGIDSVLAGHKDLKSFDEILDIISRSDILLHKEMWWRLRLINKHILRVSPDNPGYLMINDDHPAVVETRGKLKSVLRAIENLLRDSEGVQQNILLEDIKNLYAFRDDTAVIFFLHVLKDQDILYVDNPSEDGKQPLWHINPSHSLVVEQKSEQYLSLLTLALDHYLLQRGFQFVHEDQLKHILSPYISKSISEKVYEFAVAKNYVFCQINTNNESTRYNQADKKVYLNYENDNVKLALFQRDVLVDITSGYKDGIKRENLWSILKHVDRFNVSKETLDHWLENFRRDVIILIASDSNTMREDVIKANVDSVVFQRIRGRMNILGLVRNLRIIKATNPAGKKSSGEVIENLVRYVTHGNKVLAGYTLDYAKTIKLVEVVQENIDDKNVDFVYLVQYHSFLLKLRSHESDNSKLILKTIKNMYTKPGEWIPKNRILQQMEKDASFGYAREEREFWLEQAIHALKLLEQKFVKEHSQDKPQYFVKIKV